MKIKRLAEFLQDREGQFSSARLFALSMAASFIVDYQYCIWVSHKTFSPEWTVVGVVLGSLGIKFAQKFAEK